MWRFWRRWFRPKYRIDYFHDGTEVILCDQAVSQSDADCIKRLWEEGFRGAELLRRLNERQA